MLLNEQSNQSSIQFENKSINEEAVDEASDYKESGTQQQPAHSFFQVKAGQWAPPARDGQQRSDDGGKKEIALDSFGVGLQAAGMQEGSQDLGQTVWDQAVHGLSRGEKVLNLNEGTAIATNDQSLHQIDGDGTEVDRITVIEEDEEIVEERGLTVLGRSEVQPSNVLGNDEKPEVTKIEEEKTLSEIVKEKTLMRTTNQQQIITMMDETAVGNQVDTRKLNSSQAIPQQASFAELNKNWERTAQAKNQQEYIDEFLGSYNDLGIVEDDAPGSDSYQDDEYEQVDKEEELEEEIGDQGRERSPAELNLKGSRNEPLKRENTNQTLEKDGIDQRIMELKGQVKKRKVDLDDDASIPDMRVQRQKSSTLEDLNSTHTREQQSNTSTANGTNRKIRRPDDRQRRSQSRPAIDGSQMSQSMKKEANKINIQELQSTIEKQQMLNQSTEQRKSDAQAHAEMLLSSPESNQRVSGAGVPAASQIQPQLSQHVDTTAVPTQAHSIEQFIVMETPKGNQNPQPTQQIPNVPTAGQGGSLSVSQEQTLQGLQNQQSHIRNGSNVSKNEHLIGPITEESQVERQSNSIQRNSIGGDESRNGFTQPTQNSVTNINTTKSKAGQQQKPNNQKQQVAKGKQQAHQRVAASRNANNASVLNSRKDSTQISSQQQAAAQTPAPTGQPQRPYNPILSSKPQQKPKRSQGPASKQKRQSPNLTSKRGSLNLSSVGAPASSANIVHLRNSSFNFGQHLAKRQKKSNNNKSCTRSSDQGNYAAEAQQELQQEQRTRNATTVPNAVGTNPPNLNLSRQNSSKNSFGVDYISSANNNQVDTQTQNTQQLMAESFDRPQQNAMINSGSNEILNVHRGTNQRPNIVDYNQEDYPIGMTNQVITPPPPMKDGVSLRKKNRRAPSGKIPSRDNNSMLDARFTQFDHHLVNRAQLEGGQVDRGVASNGQPQYAKKSTHQTRSRASMFINQQNQISLANNPAEMKQYLSGDSNTVSQRSIFKPILSQQPDIRGMNSRRPGGTRILRSAHGQRQSLLTRNQSQSPQLMANQLGQAVGAIDQSSFYFHPQNQNFFASGAGTGRPILGRKVRNMSAQSGQIQRRMYMSNEGVDNLYRAPAANLMPGMINNRNAGPHPRRTQQQSLNSSSFHDFQQPQSTSSLTQTQQQQMNLLRQKEALMRQQVNQTGDLIFAQNITPNTMAIIPNDESSTIFSGQTHTVPESLRQVQGVAGVNGMPPQQQPHQKRANNMKGGSSVFHNGGPTVEQRRSNRGRLKSANIYSQKIKMYNPNMLIFTPHQQFNGHLNDASGTHQNSMAEMTMQAPPNPRLSTQQTGGGLESIIHFQGDTASIAGTLNPNRRAGGLQHSVESVGGASLSQQAVVVAAQHQQQQQQQEAQRISNLEINRVVQQMQGASDLEGLRLSPESLIKIGQRGINSNVPVNERSRHHRNRAAGVVNSFTSNGGKFEDLYDKLLVMKSELHRVKDQNTKLKTKNQLQEQKLKSKEKFIDDLIKQSYIMSQGFNNLSSVKPAITSKVNTGIQSDSSPQFQSPAKDIDHEARNHFRKHFIEKGPFNLLKMKRRIDDLTELVQQKNQEIEELKHNIKSTKLTELQEEVLLYQKECLKLRYIAELSIVILIKNGLHNQLKSNKRLKSFVKTINWQNFEIKNAISDFQQVVSAERKPEEKGKKKGTDLGSDIGHNENVKRRSMSQNDGRPHNLHKSSQKSRDVSNDRSGNQDPKDLQDQQSQELYMQEILEQSSQMKDQIEILQYQLKDQDKTLKELNQQREKDYKEISKLKELAAERQNKIEKLNQVITEMKQQQLNQQAREERSMSAKDKTSSTKKVQESSVEQEATKMPTEIHSPLIEELTQQNEELQAQLQSEKNQKEEIEKKFHEIKIQFDQIKKIKKSPVRFEEDPAVEGSSKDKDSKDERIKILEAENQKLMQELHESQSAQIKRNKDSLDLLMKMQEIQKESNQKQFEIDRLKILFKKQPQGALSEEPQISGGLQENKSPQDDLSMTRNRAASLQENIAVNKRPPPSILIPSSPEKNKLQLTAGRLSSVSQNSQLEEELRNLEVKLMNLDMDNIEERSDMRSDIVSRFGDVRQKLLSQKSFIENRSSHAKSPTKLMRRKTQFLEKFSETPTPQIIEEDVENEHQLETGKLQEQIEMERGQETKATTDKKKRGFLKHAGRSNSNFAADFHQNPRFDRQQTKYNMYQNMNKQIEHIADTSSIYTEDISQFGGISQAFEMAYGGNKNLQTTSYLKRDNEGVNRAFNRLKTLLQIKRSNIEQVEMDLFSAKLEQDDKSSFRNLKICEFTPILVNKLGLTMADARNFSRFLIEEPDEEAEQNLDEAKIAYDPNRKANLQKVIVRLLLYTPHATIFDKNKELEAQDQFTKAFSNKHIKFIRLVEQQAKGQDHGQINFELFKGLVHQIIGKNTLSHQTIECAYIFLCRPCPWDDVNKLLEKDLAKAVRGFESQKTFTLFTKIDDDESDQPRNSARLNSASGSSHMNQPRINLKRAENKRDSENHDKNSADTNQSQARTPVLGQKRNTGGFAGFVKDSNDGRGTGTDQNNSKQSEQYKSNPGGKDSRQNSQDIESKDKESKEKSSKTGGILAISDEQDENYDENVAPLPGSEQFEEFHRSIQSKKLHKISTKDRFSFQDDGQVEAKINYMQVPSNFADQVIQYDQLSQQNSALAQNQKEDKPKIPMPFQRMKTQKFEQTGKMKVMIPKGIIKQDDSPAINKEQNNTQKQQELQVNRQATTPHQPIQIEKGIGSALLPQKDDKSSPGEYPYNQFFGKTRNLEEVLYSEERSETDFDMQTSICRKSSYVLGMQHSRLQSQITASQERNIYNKQDKEIIRQQAAAGKPPAEDEKDGTFNYSQTQEALQIVKKQSMTQQQEALKNQSNVPRQMNKTSATMDKSLKGESRIQGVTDGTSTTMEKKAFVDTIKEEINKKNQNKEKEEQDKEQNKEKKSSFGERRISFAKLRDNDRGSQKLELENQLENQIYDKLQQKVHKIHYTYQRAITFNKNVQEMLNHSEDGDSFIESQYQVELEESWAAKKMNQELDDFVFEQPKQPEPVRQEPLQPQKIDSFAQQIRNSEVQQQSKQFLVKKPNQKMLSSETSSLSTDLNEATQKVTSSQNIQVQDYQDTVEEPATANKVENAGKFNIVSSKSSSAERPTGRAKEESSSPALLIEGKENLQKLQIVPLSTEGKEESAAPANGQQSQQNQGANGTLGNPYQRAFESSQNLQSSTGTPAFNAKDLQNYIPEEQDPSQTKKVRSERKNNTNQFGVDPNTADSLGQQQQYLLNSTNPKQLSQLQPGFGSANSSSRQVLESSLIQPIKEEEMKDFDGEDRDGEEVGFQERLKAQQMASNGGPDKPALVSLGGEQPVASNDEQHNKDQEEVVTGFGEQVKEASVDEVKEQQQVLDDGDGEQNQLQFSEARVAKLEQTLQRLIFEKIGELHAKANVKRIIDVAKDVFCRIGAKMINQNGIDQRYTIRELLKGKIYVIQDPKFQLQDEMIEQYPLLEVVKEKDLIGKFNKLFLNVSLVTDSDRNAQDQKAILEYDEEDVPLNPNEVQCIHTILQDPQMANLIPLDDIFAVFQSLGIHEYKLPNMDKMNYEMLDMKSFRILKRFLQFLSKHQHHKNKDNFSVFMEDLMSKQIVKTKSSKVNDKVYLFSSPLFFKKLSTHGIKKSPKVHENLHQFLSNNEKFPKQLIYRKLKKCLEDFNKSRFVQAIDAKKNKLDYQEFQTGATAMGMRMSEKSDSSDDNYGVNQQTNKKGFGDIKQKLPSFAKDSFNDDSRGKYQTHRQQDNSYRMESKVLGLAARQKDEFCGGSSSYYRGQGTEDSKNYSEGKEDVVLNLNFQA